MWPNGLIIIIICWGVIVICVLPHVAGWQEGGDAAWLSCVDYLLAACEYDRFLRLVADFQSMQQWEPEEGEAILLEDYCLED